MSGRNRHEILSDKSRLPYDVNHICAQHMGAVQAAQLEANTGLQLTVCYTACGVQTMSVGFLPTPG